jgi:hypothetical protein
MKIQYLIDQFEHLDDPHAEAALKESRRNWMQRSLKAAGNFMLASLPFVSANLQSTETKARAGSVADALNMALLLQYIQRKLYLDADARLLLVPDSDRAIIYEIAAHEHQQLGFLEKTIRSKGGNPVGEPNLDLTGGSGNGHGVFSNFTNDYQIFLALCQLMEDVCVCAHKALLAEVASDPEILMCVQRMHSTQARHSAMIRILRARRGWISEEETTGSAIPASGGTMVMYGKSNMQLNPLAFDEPLSREAVMGIITPFMA